MEAMRAALVTVVIDLFAFHFDGFSWLIQDLSAIDIHEVRANSLIGQNLTVWCNWNAILAKEIVEFVNRELFGIPVRAFRKGHQVLIWHSFIEEINDDIDDVCLDGLTINVEFPAKDLGFTLADL